MNFKEFKSTFENRTVVSYPTRVSATPVVTVCVQTYNQLNYIEKCLKGILMQETSFPIEILLGDDDSTDGTRDVCLDYASRFPDKIRLFLHHRENNIVINGRNTGLFNSFYNFYSSNGTYIAYCDGDDYWTDPLKLQKQINFLENNKEYVLSYHSAKIINEKGEEIKDNLVPNIHIRKDFSSLELKKALEQPIISTWCFRNVIQDIPVEITRTLNADNFWMSLLGFHGKGKFLDNISPSHYRIHTVGIWSLINKADQLASKMRTYNNLSVFYAERGELELSAFFSKRSGNYSKMLIYKYFTGKKVHKGIYYLLGHLGSRMKKKITG